MRIPLVQIDAFADEVFKGNPAAVMPLPAWLPDDVLQALAEENNLSETAFYVAKLPAEAGAPPPGGPAFHLRWFTPAVEVDLCGHATLATAAQILDDVHPDAASVGFWSNSGWLRVERAEGGLTLDFPAEPLVELPADDPLVVAAEAALGITAERRMLATDLVLVVADAATVRAVRPDQVAMAELPIRGAVVTAPADRAEPADGAGFDFVSRWFGGDSGVGEDPVTGSAHSQIAPYWAQRLGKTALTARQLSARGGTVWCEVVGDRVRLTGSYRRYLEGVVTLPE